MCKNEHSHCRVGQLRLASCQEYIGWRVTQKGRDQGTGARQSMAGCPGALMIACLRCSKPYDLTTKNPMLNAWCQCQDARVTMSVSKSTKPGGLSRAQDLHDLGAVHEKLPFLCFLVSVGQQGHYLPPGGDVAAHSTLPALRSPRFT